MAERVVQNRVVDGRRYNTETSELIADVARSGGDWTYEKTQLFRTKRGRFFLAGEGGTSTRWAKVTRTRGDRYIVEGDGVIPLTEPDARRYVEELASHRYHEFFAIAD